MKNKRFNISLGALTVSDAFADASREELRVLLALISLDGHLEETEKLATLAKVSRARTASALTFWEELGVVSTRESCVTEEFDTFNENDIEERESLSVAGSIRDENLAAMLTECAALMDKAALNTQEIKTVCVLNSEYGLSPEYITVLAAHIAAKGKLTAVRLREEGKRLAGKGIDSLEALEQYIVERENESADEWEIRRTLGIYNRNLTVSEKDYFKKWTGELGYSTSIVALAFDICVLNTGKLSCPYMDTLLSSWHKAGCKTIEECRSANASHKAQGDSEAEKSPRKRARTEPPKPRYGDFNVDEAFKHALSRSFGDDED
ncbi:MAG: DnaD domain protein [Clostridia bacterium]|nr:DnaD domain protein [Clostridia bacterium]